MAKPITSLTGFVRKIAELTEKRQGERLLFRGHKKKSYEARPSIFREEKWEENEHEMIRQLLADHPAEFNQDRTSFEKLVRAQHYGLPTRLLDVTHNPLVALYFACEPDDKENGEIIVFSPNKKRQKFFDSNTVSALSNLSFLTFPQKKRIISYSLKCREEAFSKHPDDENEFNKLLVKIFNDNEDVAHLAHLIRQERRGFEKRIHPSDISNIIYVSPRKLHKRLEAQNGAFLVFGLFHDPKSYLFIDEIEITEIYISKNKKEKIRHELRQIGIRDETLFPEIDRSATQIKETFLR